MSGTTLKSLKVALLISSCIFFIVMTMAIIEYHRLRKVFAEVEVQFNAGDLIKYRIDSQFGENGIISIPVRPIDYGDETYQKSHLGGIRHGDELTERWWTDGLNSLAPGNYRYFTFNQGKSLRFILLNDQLQVVASGYVPSEPTKYRLGSDGVNRPIE